MQPTIEGLQQIKAQAPHDLRAEDAPVTGPEASPIMPHLRSDWVRAGMAMVLVAALVAMLVPFLIPIMMAAIFAVALRPVTERLSSRMKSRKWGVSIVVTVVMVALVLPLVVIILRTVNIVQGYAEGGGKDKIAQQLMETFEAWGQQLTSKINPMLAGLGVPPIKGPGNWSAQFAGVGESIGQGLGNMAMALPDYFLSLFLFCLCLYVFLARARFFRELWSASLGLGPEDDKRLSGALSNSCHSVIYANAAVGAVQAAVICTGAYFADVGDIPLIFIITFVMSFIPMLGTAPIALGLALLGFARGDSTAGVAMLAVGLFTGVIDNLLRPFLFSNGRSELHPLLALLAVLGGALLIGFPGLFLGPWAAQFAVDALPVLVRRLGLISESSWNEGWPARTGVRLPQIKLPNLPNLRKGRKLAQ